MDTRTTKVSINSKADVDDFLEAVKAKNSNKLSAIDASDLQVYRNKASFDQLKNAQEQGEGPLKSSHLMADLGTTEEEALAVVVPVFPNRAAQQVESTGKLGVLIFNSSITISIAWKEY